MVMMPSGKSIQKTWTKYGRSDDVQENLLAAF